MAQDVVNGLPKDRAASVASRCSEHHDLGLPARGLRHNCFAGVAGSKEASDYLNPVQLARGSRIVEQSVGGGFLLGQLYVEGQLQWDFDRCHRSHGGASLRREPECKIERDLRLEPIDEWDDDAAVFER